MIGRVFRIVRTPLTLLVLLGVLAYGAWWGYTNVLKPLPPLPPDPCVEQKVTKGQLTTSQVTVSVYNGGHRRGLAGDVGRALREGLQAAADLQHRREDRRHRDRRRRRQEPRGPAGQRLLPRRRRSRPTSARTVRSTCWSATGTAASTRTPRPPSR